MGIFKKIRNFGKCSNCKKPLAPDNTKWSHFKDDEEYCINCYTELRMDENSKNIEILTDLTSCDICGGSLLNYSWHHARKLRKKEVYSNNPSDYLRVANICDKCYYTLGEDKIDKGFFEEGWI